MNMAIRGRNSFTLKRKVAYCFHRAYSHEIYSHPINPHGHFLNKFDPKWAKNGEKLWA